MACIVMASIGGVKGRGVKRPRPAGPADGRPSDVAAAEHEIAQRQLRLKQLRERKQASGLADAAGEKVVRPVEEPTQGTAGTPGNGETAGPCCGLGPSPSRVADCPQMAAQLRAITA